MVNVSNYSNTSLYVSRWKGDIDEGITKKITIRVVINNSSYRWIQLRFFNRERPVMHT